MYVHDSSSGREKEKEKNPYEIANSWDGKKRPWLEKCAQVNLTGSFNLFGDIDFFFAKKQCAGTKSIKVWASHFFDNLFCMYVG